MHGDRIGEGKRIAPLDDDSATQRARRDGGDLEVEQQRRVGATNRAGGEEVGAEPPSEHKTLRGRERVERDAGSDGGLPYTRVRDRLHRLTL